MYQTIRLFHLSREMELIMIFGRASRVLEATVEKAYDGEKKIVWKEVLAGKKHSTKQASGYGRNFKLNS